MFRFLFKVFWNSMAVLGVLSICAGVYGGYWMMQSYNLTPIQFAVKIAGKLGINEQQVEKALSPASRFKGYVFQGKMRSTHPRIIFRNKSQIETLRQRYYSDKNFHLRVDSTLRWKGLLWRATSWVCGTHYEAGKKAINALVNAQLTLPRDQGGFGNGVDIALAYDLLHDHPDWTTEKRQRVNILLRKSLRTALVVLDGNSASLWHGRFQLACSAWIVAAAMDIDWEKERNLLSNTQAHFLDAINAINISGGWPEGYNYWINNRAFPFVLSCLAHINSVDTPEINKRILDTLNNIGLWTIYGTEPIGRFLLFGDVGPRNDLKDETQRVIDLIAFGTRKSIYRNYSRYLYGLRKGAGYYSAYRWGVPLFRGFKELDFNKKEALKDLSIFDEKLKTSAIFGRNNFGQAFIRSDWGRNATFISYRAGHSMAHHGHYQAGHFTITKKVPLAITSGTYGGYTSPHRLNYYIRTVAANSLLILRPNEKVRPNRFFDENVADGGQRIVIPTGSSVLSVKDWQSNLHKGKHYEGGKITAFENSDSEYVYIGSDLTDAYNNTQYDDNGKNGKVSSVTRQLVYLNDEDVLIVHDRIFATDGQYAKKWLLHSWTKPQTTNEYVLKGGKDNGILETKDNRALIKYDGAKLHIAKLFPENGVIRKIGGPDYRYYVEVDGDDSDIDGVNIGQGEKEAKWYDAGLWRIEIQPNVGNKFDRFLILLKPEIDGKNKPFVYKKIESGKMTGVKINQTAVLFGQKGIVNNSFEYTMPDKEICLHILVDMPSNREAEISADDKTTSGKISEQGVLMFKTTPSRNGVIRIDFVK